MTPFQQFRLWIRRAPISERAGALASLALLVSGLVYVVLPGHHPTPVTVADRSAPGYGVASANGPGSDGASPLEVSSPAANPVGTPGSSGSGTGGNSALRGGGSLAGGAGAGVSSPGGTPGGGHLTGGGSSPTGGCTSPPGNDQGVSASQMKIAVTLVNIAGPAANNVFGIQSASQQQTVFNAVIASINAGGGIACRKVVPLYYQANPADSSQLEQTCLDVAQAGVFAVIDPGSYSVTTPFCFSDNRLPYFGGFILTQQESQHGYPYLFDLGNEDQLLKDTVFGFHARGSWSPAGGFKKLGVFYHDCHPELYSEEMGWLRQVGMTSAQIVPYDFGCPSAFAAPSDVEQAVLKFQQNGVTDVTDINAEGDFVEFTNIAEQQGFHPHYTVPDEELLGISSGAEQPNQSNLASALAVTASRNGENNTPGMAPSTGTQKCNAIFAAHGLAPVYQEGQEAGDVCNELWMVQAAAEHAPVLQRNALAAGLQATGSIDFSYPQGPNLFSAPHTTTAGQYWRVAEFFQGCDCWRVVDPTFHPGY